MSMTDPLIGKRLGDYMIEGILGAGGMARVYRGYDDNLDRYAAVKVIEPQLIASAEEDEYRERFLREARAIARLNHSNIVSIYQFNQVGTLYYIAMEYVEGRNLRDVLKGYLRQGRLIPTDELLMMLRDIADALDYAHKQGIIHRDIKPSNIIVTEENHAVLTDFGLALNAVEGTIGNTFGSVHYIAPEQAISSAQAVPQSDQYSLGIVAYELLTGRVPFDDASAMSVALKHISDPPPPPTELNPNIPAEVEQVLMRVLDKEVAKRFETCKEFVQSLEIAFEMVDKADVDAPSGISAAVGGQPATSPVPPPELAATRKGTSGSDSIRDDMQAASDSASIGSLGAQAQAMTPAGRMGWMIAVGLIVIVVIAGGFMLMSNIARNNEIATETAVAMIVQTDDAVAAMQETSEAQTQTAIDAQETSDAATAMQETSEAQTQTAIDAQETSDAATAMQETSEAQAQVAIDAQETSDAATAIQETSEAQTQVAIDAQETSDAQTQAAQERATENAVASEMAQALVATPTPTMTPSPTPTKTPTVTPSNTPRPTNTPLPPLIIEDLEIDTAQVLLRYDGRSLIIANRDPENRIDVSDLSFTLHEPDENGIIRETITFNVRFSAIESPAENMIPERCLQILDNSQFSGLPTDNPLAETICGSTPFWLASSNIFWLNDSPEAYFEVRLGPVDVIGECQTQRRLTRAEKICVIDLNALR